MLRSNHLAPVDEFETHQEVLTAGRTNEYRSASHNTSLRVVALEDCVACGGATLKPLARPTTWIGAAVFEPVARSVGLTRCQDCSFVFVNPRPPAELIQAFYDVDDYDCHEHDNPANRPSTRLEHVVDLLEPFRHKARSRRLLDFGCGGGYFVKAAQARGWNAIGYDIGQRSRAVCAELGVPFVDDLSSLRQERFDLITLHHVFEHIDDHVAFFERIGPLIDDQTLLYIEVPNVRSLRARLAAPALTTRFPVDERFRAFPIHLSYFNFDTLARVLKRYGYSVVADFNFGIGLDEYFTELPGSLGAMSDGSNGARQRAASSASGEPRRSRRAVQALKNIVKRTLWQLRLGENLAVVAQRIAAPPGSSAVTSKRVMPSGR